MCTAIYPVGPDDRGTRTAFHSGNADPHDHSSVVYAHVYSWSLDGLRSVRFLLLTSVRCSTGGASLSMRTVVTLMAHAVTAKARVEVFLLTSYQPANWARGILMNWTLVVTC